MTEKELLAVVYGIEKMRRYLEGYSFSIITDHQCLKYLKSMDKPSGRIARWTMILQQFDFDGLYRKGSENTVADPVDHINTISNKTKPDW